MTYFMSWLPLIPCQDTISPISRLILFATLNQYFFPAELLGYVMKHNERVENIQCFLKVDGKSRLICLSWWTLWKQLLQLLDLSMEWTMCLVELFRLEKWKKKFYLTSHGDLDINHDQYKSCVCVLIRHTCR